MRSATERRRTKEKRRATWERKRREKREAAESAYRRAMAWIEECMKGEVLNEFRRLLW